MANTIFLLPSTWDFALDNSGNIAMATEPYALAQDAASACLTFIGDLYYAPSAGIPYFASVLGQLPPIAYVKQLYVNAALTVPDVVAAQVFFSSFTNRTLAGQVQISNKTGIIGAAAFGNVAPSTVSTATSPVVGIGVVGQFIIG